MAADVAWSMTRPVAIDLFDEGYSRIASAIATELGLWVIISIPDKSSLSSGGQATQN